jgi:hypothetical protein
MACYRLYIPRHIKGERGVDSQLSAAGQYSKLSFLVKASVPGLLVKVKYTGRNDF